MRTKTPGFSLVELLVVLGVIVLLASISMPVLTSINKGADLGAAAVQVSGQLDLARQTAQTLNVPVEVRVYETRDSTGTLAYNAIAVYEVGEDADGDGLPDAYNLLGKVAYLPLGCLFSSATLSSLISDTGNKGQADLPGQNGVNYAAFRFTASGVLALPAQPASASGWTLAILAKKDASAATLPAQYAVVTVGSAGIVRVTRP